VRRTAGVLVFSARKDHCQSHGCSSGTVVKVKFGSSITMAGEVDMMVDWMMKASTIVDLAEGLVHILHQKEIEVP